MKQLPPNVTAMVYFRQCRYRQTADGYVWSRCFEDAQVWGRKFLAIKAEVL